MLVVVDGGATEGAHGLALGSADEDEQFVGRVVAHLAGIDDEAGGDFDVAEVLRDFSAIHHGAAEDYGFATVLTGELEGDADAIDRRREATEEELLFSLGKN